MQPPAPNPLPAPYLRASAKPPPCRTNEPPARSSRRPGRPNGAFTIVEIALVLSIAGMVLAVAVPTFVQQLESSKTAEASKHLEILFRNSAAYYAVARATTDGETAHCLPPAAGPAPAVPAPDPVAVDFQAEDMPGASTWRALEFAPSDPLRYRYSFLPAGPACAAPEPGALHRLTLRAEGDLDADGTLSRFERRAKLRPHGLLDPERILHVSDRIE